MDDTVADSSQDPVLRLRPDTLEWLLVDDEVVVLDGVQDLYLGTNSSGAELWQALANGATRSGLVDLLVVRYQIERERAEVDVDGFLGQLFSEHLLEEA